MNDNQAATRIPVPWTETEIIEDHRKKNATNLCNHWRGKNMSISQHELEKQKSISQYELERGKYVYFTVRISADFTFFVKILVVLLWRGFIKTIIVVININNSITIAMK